MSLHRSFETEVGGQLLVTSHNPEAIRRCSDHNTFRDDYISGLRQYKQRRIILLVDFDDQDGRYDDIKGKIPSGLQNRVSSEPEKLLASVKGLNNLEDIGKALAEDCLDDTSQIWGHDLLKHNEPELQ